LCLELQELNDQIFGDKPTEVLQPKEQRVVNVAFPVRRRQDQLVSPEERVKVCVVEVFLLAGAAVWRGPQLDRVSGELDGLEAGRENGHDDSRQQEHLE